MLYKTGEKVRFRKDSLAVVKTIVEKQFKEGAVGTVVGYGERITPGQTLRWADVQFGTQAPFTNIRVVDLEPVAEKMEAAVKMEELLGTGFPVEVRASPAIEAPTTAEEQQKAQDP